jgi:uncharacterized protein with PhoU and TrkA domain
VVVNGPFEPPYVHVVTVYLARRTSADGRAGRPLADSQLHLEHGVVVVGVLRPGGELLYNPRPDVVLGPDAVLVALGQPMGPVIASIHEKRDEFRDQIKEGGALDYRPQLRTSVAER